LQKPEGAGLIEMAANEFVRCSEGTARVLN
jgi:hypothetical protein